MTFSSSWHFNEESTRNRITWPGHHQNMEEEEIANEIANEAKSSFTIMTSMIKAISTPWQWESLEGGELVVREVELLQVLQRGEEGGGQLVYRVPCKASI